MRTRRPCRVLALMLIAATVAVVGCSSHPMSSVETTAPPGSGTSQADSGPGQTVGPPSDSGSGSHSARGTASKTGAPTTRRTGSNVLVGSDDNFCAVITAEWGALGGRAVTLDIGSLAGAGTAGSPAAAMQATLADFTACTGVTVTVTADPTLDGHLLADALDDKTSDLVVIHGPSLLARLAQTGTLAPAPRLVQADLDKLWDSGWRTGGTVNGVLYAAPLDVAAQGLVWYSPVRFKAWGYHVPASWADLVALARTAARSGHGWCPTADPGQQVRNWLTEVMLRQANTQAYDAWAAGTLPFDDQTVAAALTTVGALLGVPAASATSTGSSATSTGSVAGPAGAAALGGGAFALALGDQQWPAGASASIGPDGDLYAFAIPPIAARSGTPLLVDADLVVAFADRPEVQALRYYLSTAYWAGEQYAATGRISANRGLEVVDVTDPVAKLVVTALQDKTAVSRFDAAEVMPAAVVKVAGAQLGRWAAGVTSANAALTAVADSWPPG